MRKVFAANADTQFKDGDRVRLNVKRIMSDPDYNRKLPGYRDFVERSRRRVFTVRREGGLCCFKELGPNGWLFWDGDLLPAKKERGS